MPSWILHEAFNILCLWVILSLAYNSRFISSLRKGTGSGLIAVSDTDLSGIVVKTSKTCSSTALVLLFEKLKHGVPGC